MQIVDLKTSIFTRVLDAVRSIWGPMDLESLPELKLEFPPKVELGHFALGCFPLAKILKTDRLSFATKCTC